jgi:hypothetical protein
MLECSSCEPSGFSRPDAIADSVSPALRMQTTAPPKKLACHATPVHSSQPTASGQAIAPNPNMD